MRGSSKDFWYERINRLSAEYENIETSNERKEEYSEKSPNTSFAIK